MRDLQPLLPFIAIAAVLGMPLISAQAEARTPPAALKEMGAIRKVFQQDGNHLRAVDGLRDLARKYADSRRDMQAVSQFLGTRESWLGNERKAINLFAVHLFGNRLPPGHAEPPPADAVAQPLREVIVSLVKDHQLVLVNEAHHISRHRATTRSLLQPLYETGFRYLAMEALGEPAKMLEARGYPVADSGFYLKDPEFGDMIREALRLGYTLIQYEPANSQSQQERERGQAANIAAVLEKDPDARILVHAGYQHIEESGLLFGARTMAQHLEEMTGIDPLTVNQAALTWAGDALEPNAIYSRAMQLAPATSEAFVLKTADGPWSLEPERYDVSVVTPPTRYLENGRPEWLLRAGNRSAVTLDVPDGARLVEARLKNESADGVPVDRVEIRSGESVTLLLPAGDYRLSWYDIAGEQFASEALPVEGS
ncbi:MAG TPA: hypothetical protein VF275_05730 [Gammaproteobacteria bacterium]